MRMHRWTLTAFAALVALAGVMLAIRLLNTPQPEGLIVVEEGGELHLVDGALQNWRTLDFDDTYAEIAPQWSPDGEHIAFVGFMGTPSDNVSLVMLTDAQGSEPVVASYRGTSAAAPRWSPNGEMIVYEDNESRTIYVTDIVDGTTEAVVSGYPRWVESIDWSADSQTLAVVAAEPGNSSSLYLLPVNAGRQPIDQLTVHRRGVLRAAFAPTDNRLAYVQTGWGYELVIADGSRERRLSFGSNRVRSLIWAPHGRGVFHAAGTGRFGFTVLYKEDYAHMLLVSGLPLDISPDGRYLLYTTEAGQLCTLRLDRPSTKHCSWRTGDFSRASWQP